jgi:hypothetical protein
MNTLASLTRRTTIKKRPKTPLESISEEDAAEALNAPEPSPLATATTVADLPSAPPDVDVQWATFRSLETCYAVSDAISASWLRAISIKLNDLRADSPLDDIRDGILLLATLSTHVADPSEVAIRCQPWFPAPVGTTGAMNFINCPITATLRWITWHGRRTWLRALHALQLPEIKLEYDHDQHQNSIAQVRADAYGLIRVLLWFAERFHQCYAYAGLTRDVNFVAACIGAIAQVLFTVSPEARDPHKMARDRRIRAIDQSVQMLELTVTMPHQCWSLTREVTQQLRGLYWAELGDVYKSLTAFLEAEYAYRKAVYYAKRYRSVADAARAELVGSREPIKSEPFDRLKVYTCSFAAVLPAEHARMVLAELFSPMPSEWLPRIPKVARSLPRTPGSG